MWPNIAVRLHYDDRLCLVRRERPVSDSVHVNDTLGDVGCWESAIGISYVMLPVTLYWC